MNPPPMLDTTTIPSTELTGFAPSELRRRLRHACVLLGAAEQPTSQREQILRRVRGHLGGTMQKLDRLIADVTTAPIPMDDQLTERHQAARIDPSP